MDKHNYDHQVSGWKLLSCTAGLLWLAFSSRPAFAADPELASFQNSVFGISEISHFYGAPEQMGSLSAATRSEVIRAKSVLVNVLKSVQDTNVKAQPYLTGALHKKFPTEQLFVQSLLYPETSVIALIMTDLTLSANDTQVVFRFSLLLDSEGSLVTADRSARLLKVGADWKLDGIQ